MDQEQFAKEAMDEYVRLPDEENSLYTRRYARIDPGSLSNVDLSKDHEKLAIDFYDRLHASTGMGFDAIVTESGIMERFKHNPSLKFEQFGSYGYGKALEGSSFSNGEDKYVSLVHATSKAALVVDAPSGSTVELRILFLGVKASLPMQIFIDVREGSKLHISEWHASTASNASFSGITRDIRVHHGASCSIDVLHNENSNTSVIENSRANVSRDGRFAINYIYTGGSVVRARNQFNANGHESSVTATEMAITSMRQRMDLNTRVINSASKSEARLISKVVAMDESLCYLKGFAGIANGSRDSRSYVEEHGMLIGSASKISSMPCMEIGENMVKATHSSATGPIDPEAMFYLMSKGMSEDIAKQLLVTGFFSNPISRIENPLAREVASSIIIGKIRAHGSIEDTPRVSIADTVWSNSASGDSLERHYKYRKEV